MGLFKRLSTSMFAPREAINFRRDKWYVVMLYFIILLVITIMPLLTIFFQKELITYDVQQQVKNVFSGENIPFTISDKLLVHKTNDNSFVYTKEFENGINVVITTKDELKLEELSSINIVFHHDGVYLQQALFKYKLFLYGDYSSLANIDLAKASEYNNTQFWNEIFTVIEAELKEYRPFIRLFSILSYLFENALNLIFISLIFAFIQSFGLSRIIKFSELWKICIYLMAPFVMGSVLYLLFSNILLYYAGFFMSATYVFIISKNLQKDAMRRKDNEF